MPRVILIIVLVIVVMAWWSRRNRRAERPPMPSRKPLESMVTCAHCGVHLPRGDAIAGAGEQVYCCDAHRQQDKRPPR